MEDLDEFHQLFWNSIVPQDFPKALPVHTVKCFFEIYEVNIFFFYIHSIALESTAK